MTPGHVNTKVESKNSILFTTLSQIFGDKMNLALAKNYAIKGAVWYQGESNAERYQEHQKLLADLITDWRLKHAQGNFPFIIAQLPNFMEAKDQPSESSWASFRNVQLNTLYSQSTSTWVIGTTSIRRTKKRLENDWHWLLNK